jgi:hypothetical protein
MPNKNYVNRDMFLRGGSIASSCWTGSLVKFTLLGLVVTPNINTSAKGAGYLMHTNEHIFHKICLFYSKNTVFYVRL